MEFELGQDYNNVYFMSVDAKGHSTIVASNDADKADMVFDGFEQMVYQAVDSSKEASRCDKAEFWGWAGDGGLCVFYDTEESRARETALHSAIEILHGMSHLNDQLGRRHVAGTVRVRIAVHKGHFRYKGDQRRGSIHSRQLNFCAHLEKVVPADTLAISQDVYELIPPAGKADYLLADGPFEGRGVHLYSERDPGELNMEWRRTTTVDTGNAAPLSSDMNISEFGLLGVYSQRALTDTFRRIFEGLRDRLWVMGIGLAGFRSDHDSAVIDLLGRGVDVRLLALEPEPQIVGLDLGAGAISLPEWCDLEDGSNYNSRAASSVGPWVASINSQLGATAKLSLRYYHVVPSAALLVADDGVFVSPFCAVGNNVKLPTIQVTAGGRIGRVWRRRFQEVWASDDLSRDGTSTA